MRKIVAALFMSLDGWGDGQPGGPNGPRCSR
jgi:hypothetical protein